MPDLGQGSQREIDRVAIGKSRLDDELFDRRDVGTGGFSAIVRIALSAIAGDGFDSRNEDADAAVCLVSVGHPGLGDLVAFIRPARDQGFRLGLARGNAVKIQLAGLYEHSR